RMISRRAEGGPTSCHLATAELEVHHWWTAAAHVGCGRPAAFTRRSRVHPGGATPRETRDSHEGLVGEPGGPHIGDGTKFKPVASHHGRAAAVDLGRLSRRSRRRWRRGSAA